MTACTCRERYSASELLYNYILHLIGYFRHVTSLLMRAARRPAAIVNAVITHTDSIIKSRAMSFSLKNPRGCE